MTRTHLYGSFFCSWAALAREWEKGTLGDQDIERAVNETVFFQAAAHPNARHLISVEVFDEIIREYTNYSKGIVV